jgi:hypothetical protein
MITFVSAFLGQARDSDLFPLLEFIPRKDGRKVGTEWEQLLCLVFFGAFCGLITLLALDSEFFLASPVLNKNISYRPISHIDMLASDYYLLIFY